MVVYFYSVLKNGKKIGKSKSSVKIVPGIDMHATNPLESEGDCGNLYTRDGRGCDFCQLMPKLLG